MNKKLFIPGVSRCPCGSPAKKLKWGSPCCARCDEWETRYEEERHADVRAEGQMKRGKKVLTQADARVGLG